MARPACSLPWRCCRARSSVSALPSPPSGVSEILATSGWGIPRPDHAALSDGQLRHPQASQRAAWLKRHPRFVAHFVPDQFQLARTSWNVRLENSRPKPSAAAHSPASPTWSRPSRHSWRPGTKIPTPSSGPQPSSRSRPSLHDVARLSNRPRCTALEPEKENRITDYFSGHHTSFPLTAELGTGNAMGTGTSPMDRIAAAATTGRLRLCVPHGAASVSVDRAYASCRAMPQCIDRLIVFDHWHSSLC